jgi:hypothetical protein
VDALALTCVLGLAALAILAAQLFFRHRRLAIPAIGVFDLADAAVIGALIALVPFAYLALPFWLLASLFALGGASLLQLVCEATVPRSAVWPVVLGATAAEILALRALGPSSAAFLLVNDGLLVVLVVALANLWAQSGMKARDAMLLGGGIAAYDYLATLRTPLTIDLIDRLAGVPFSPRVAFAGHGATILSIGLGDLLFASLFPLLMLRAYGSRAATVATAANLIALATITLAVDTRAVHAWPAMVVLWPLMGAQYCWWRQRHGAERSTVRYRGRRDPHGPPVAGALE